MRYSYQELKSMKSDRVKHRFYSQKFAKGLILSDRLEKVLSVFRGHHFNRMLDIGCGDGSFSLLLKNFSDEVYGIDISEDAIRLAREKGIKAYIVDLDGEKLPFENDFFNAVFCGEVIEHLYDPDNLLDEIQRVLVPEGICVITTPNLASWLNRIVLLFGFQPYFTEISLKYNVGKFGAKTQDISGHIRVFTCRSLKELLKLHGFSVEKNIGVNIAKDLPFLIRPIERLFSRKASLASYLVFVAKKQVT